MDRDVASTHPRFPPFQFDVPETPDAVQEDAAVQLGLSTAPSLRERLETRVGLSLTTIVAVLTALTLAVSLLVSAIRFVAVLTRSYDQMQKVAAIVVHLDSTVAQLVVRMDRLEARRPPRVGARTP